MRATTLNEAEEAPASYPNVTHWIGDFRVALPGDPTVSQVVTWQRIEAWIATRWTARSVVYIAEGSGEWLPRLSPFTTTTVQLWRNSSWATVTLDPTPLGGLQLPTGDTYRITGIAGDDSPHPEAVLEAWRRLHEFQHAAAFSKWNETAFVGGDEGITRAWAAKEMHLSGAADLLRPWRNMR
ncbi:MAG: hypothetical protein AAGK00_18255 [Pseudomonadota bacterium]